MSKRSWVSHPYGLEAAGEDEHAGAERAAFDERGCHTVYEWRGDPASSEAREVASGLQKRRETARARGQLSVFDAYRRGASLWFGDEPSTFWETSREHPKGRTLACIQRLLWRLTCGAAPRDWRARALLLQAMRRIVLRESVLVRMLPSEQMRDSAGWGELLSRKFVTHLPHQLESMADRIAALLEDIEAASGDLHDPTSARHSWYAATRLRDQQFAALVTGTTGSSSQQTRERVLAGFNTPLLPEVLICTAVGQEGIDLHRHCRHVIHYDLPWNPAVLEQRTGRADRIGSKTFRERAASTQPGDVSLEMSVPFLAATYDERVFEELRLRAQTFEVLTGGDFALDHIADERSDSQPGAERELRMVPLPPAMIEALRVHLHVWTRGVY